MTIVKICGLTNLDDAQVACDAGADLLGFIFARKSPRYVTPSTVAEIVAILRPHYPTARFVGVFVNATRGTVQTTLDEAGLDLAQLHGDELPAMLAALPGRSYKALQPQSLAEAALDAARYAPNPTDLLLLDAYHPTLRGGTGHTGDWALAAQIAARHRVLLAGGLNAQNVAQAVEAVQPWGVDVSSGVEARPGVKDLAQLRRFVTHAKQFDESKG